MADEEVQEEEKQKSPIMMIVLVIVGVLLLVGISIFGTLFAVGKFDSNEETAEEAVAALEEEVEAEAQEAATAGPQLLETPEETKLDTNYFKLPQALVANVKDSKKVMQVSVAIVTHYDQQVIDNIEKHQIALTSGMLKILRQKTEYDLKLPEFESELAEELRFAMNAELEAYEDFGGIERVFFPEFIIQ